MQRLAIALMLLLLGPACTCSPDASLSDDALREADWDTVVEDGRDRTVRWFFWSGDPRINDYVDEYVAAEVEERYGIDLIRVPIDDAALAINRLLAEKDAGQDDKGRVDLIWINGENFRTGYEAGLFFGPFAAKLPNWQYIDASDPSIANDFGVPHLGYESPWSRAQFVMIYNTDELDAPPTTLEALTAFIEANPGRFTYPAPPNFTGSAFLRHLLYEVAGGAEPFEGEFDEVVWDAVSPALFELLERWEPSLWREGETYPESSSRLHQLYGQGEVWLSMSYGPETASAKIEEGQFPESTRTFVFDFGTIANTNFVAIPFNSPHKAAAMLVANVLLEPAAQIRKQDPDVWGAMTVLDLTRLDEDDAEAFEDMPRGVATLDLATLNAAALPEIHPSWSEVLEAVWRERIAP